MHVANPNLQNKKAAGVVSRRPSNLDGQASGAGTGGNGNLGADCHRNVTSILRQFGARFKNFRADPQIFLVSRPLGMIQYGW
jgi:hypothetical protein